ncbi:MAG: energy-coupling factor ABC transporter permease, partial [Solirubrobacterales bacterium]|nr:energy-coupling factor ABC transporter permease [Solirubrobacterales bacterium]
AQRAVRMTRPVFLGLVAAVSWGAVMLGAAATAILLGISGTVPLGAALAPMLGVHALIGIGEAVITVAALSAVLASRPDLLFFRPTTEPQAALRAMQEA